MKRGGLSRLGLGLPVSDSEYRRWLVDEVPRIIWRPEVVLKATLLAGKFIGDLNFVQNILNKGSIYVEFKVIIHLKYVQIKIWNQNGELNDV